MGMGFRAARGISETFSEQHCSKDSLFSFSSARRHLKMHPGLKIRDFVFANLDRDFFFFSSVGVVLSHPYCFYSSQKTFLKCHLKIKSCCFLKPAISEVRAGNERAERSGVPGEC